MDDRVLVYFQWLTTDLGPRGWYWEDMQGHFSIPSHGPFESEADAWRDATEFFATQGE